MENKMITPVIECVIFNCDNVLLNTETIIISVLLDIAEGYGLSMELDEAVWLFSDQGIEQSITDLKNLLEVTIPNNFDETVKEKIYDELRHGLEVREGVKEMLEQLEIPFCAVSNSSRKEIEFNLSLTGLIEFFTPEKLFINDEIMSTSLNTELYIHIAKIMGYKPGQCAVIVDSIIEIKDIIKAGFSVYGIPNGFNKEKMMNMGAVVLEEIIELPKLLKIF